MGGANREFSFSLCAAVGEDEDDDSRLERSKSRDARFYEYAVGSKLCSRADYIRYSKDSVVLGEGCRYGAEEHARSQPLRC